MSHELIGTSPWQISSPQGDIFQGLDSNTITLSKEQKDAIRGNIQHDSSVGDSIKTDVSVLLKNPDNNEQKLLIGLYTNENQKITIDGKEMTFEDICNLPINDQESIRKKMTRIEQKSLKQYIQKKIEQTDIKTKKADDEKEEVTIDTKRELEKLVQRLLSLIDQKGKDLIESSLQSIKSDPTKSPIAQDLIQRGQATETSIRDGTSDAVLKTHIIIGRSSELSPTDPDKAKEFSDIIRQIRESTGLPATPESLNAIFDSHVMGPNRPSLELAAHETLSSGRYERIRWDNENRLLVFEGRGNTQVIDTLREPPARMIIRNGLSISRDISYSPDDMKGIKGKDEEQSRLNKGTRALEDTSAIFWNGRRSEYGAPDIYSTYVRENRRLHDQYETLEGQYARGEVEPKNRVATLEQMESLTKSMRENNDNRILEKGDTATGGAISELLERRGERLMGVIRAEKQLQSIDQKKLNFTPSSDTGGAWENIANDNLAWLTERGFDRLGPKSQVILDQILATINADRTDTNQIQLGRDNITSWKNSNHRDTLKRCLEKLGGTPDVLRDSERLDVFKQSLMSSIPLSRDHPQSIYSRLRGVPKVETKQKSANTGAEYSGPTGDLA